MNTTPRYIFSLPRTPVETAVEIVALLGIVLCVGIVAESWSTLPEKIPHRFDFSGRPNAWGGRWGLLALPVGAVVLYIVLTAVVRIPHRFNYHWPITEQNIERQYRIVRSMIAMLKTEVVYIDTYIAWMTVRTAKGDSDGLGVTFLLAVFIAVPLTIIVHLIAASRAR